MLKRERRTSASEQGLKWTSIALYGLALGLLSAALQFFQYRLVMLKHATD